MDEDCNLEDESTMQSSTGSLNMQFQKELRHNKLLPYADDLEAESQNLLAEIKGNLGRAVMLRELQPGCSLWATRLCKYIKIYGMKFSKEDHILFVKLMYELVTVPNLEPFLLNKFASTLVLLLKKKELISPDELELPWRPLYDLIQHIWRSGGSRAGMFRYSPCLGTTMDSLVRAVKVYFPLNATQEILDELRPTLCPFDGMIMSTSMEKLERFLPVQLPPKHYSMGHELWFHEFMNLWEVCLNAPQWENELMWLMARLASHNIGYINWEPHLPIMFTRFMRCLNLPVLYNQTKSTKQHRIETSTITIWIVSVLGNGSSAQTYLDKFLKTIETYFHPANSGRWLGKLREILMKLPYHFLLRLHKERYAKPTWETPIPEEYKLTDDDIDAFVKSMMPVAMTAMFSKLGVNDACQALQHLATVRPRLVIPQVLERMYSTLVSLTEPHKLMATMICMAAVARPMVQGSRNVNKGYTYPEGPSQVLPLLFSFLPGIDPNDTGKCFITFRLISVYATLIPIVDSSRSTAEMDEDERLLCESTSRFEDFILQFLDRVFLLIDSSSLESIRLESRTGDGKSKLETVAETALAGVFMTVLVQSSDQIFQCALHKLRSFVTERILETKVAGQLAAVLCRIFARVKGKETLRALVPVLSQTILDIIGEGDDILKEENLDNRLLYVMLLLSAVVDTAGSHLLPHMNTLTKVLDHVLLLKSREGNNSACRLLKTIVHSLSTTVVYQFRSTERDYNDPNYPYIRDWGQALDVDSLVVDWYVPGKNEIAIVQEIFNKYVPSELDKLQRYCEDTTTLTKEELLTSLTLVSNVVSGCESVLPVWSEKPCVVIKSCLEWVPFTPTLGPEEEITMPDGSNVRLHMAGIMSTLQKVMLQRAEDDMKSFSVLVQIWSSILLGKIRMREAHETRYKNFQAAKRMFVDKLVGSKGHMGPFILERADIQHGARLQAQTFILTETHKFIMTELLTLATSRYADIRSKAQSSLFCALQHFPSSYTFIVPRLIDILKMDTEEHHDAHKGVLYILLGPQQDPIIIRRDWKMLRALWPAIVLSKPSEKFSVIKLKGHLTETVHKHFPTIAITMEVPDNCIQAASALWETYPQPTLPQPDEGEIEKGLDVLREIGESNTEAYKGLMDDLLHAIVEENIHWRHRLMAMSFIRDLVHPDQIYPPKVVRYFLGALVHDSLEERKIAILTVEFMLNQQKRKHPKITIDVPTPKDSESAEENAPVVPGQRPDNFWLQYNYETRPQTAEEWDKPRFIHQMHIGYYSWPKKLEVYAPSSQQPCLDPKVRVLTEHEKEVDLFFNDPQNIEKLVKFHSLEEKKGKDKFNSRKYLLFKNVFRNHGIVYLKHFLPHLRNLVTDKQESNQRCATEIIAGIISGAKHWPFDMTRELWDSLLPIIRLGLANLTVETVVDWGVCFATAQLHRDPNRHHWFLECLMEEPPLGDAESSFIKCARLYTLQGALIQQSWRVSELMQRLLARLEDRLLTNPFEIVRERLGSVLVSVFIEDLRFPDTPGTQLSPRVQTFMDKIVPKLQCLVDENDTIYCKEEQSLSQKVANVKFDETKDKKINEEEKEMAVRLLKTICKWIILTMSRSLRGIIPEFYRIFPIICQLENCETDEELSKTCSSTLAVLAQGFTLACDMPVALSSVSQMSKSSSWWTRSTCLKFLQVLVFQNMSILLSNPEWVNCVSDVVLHLLEDERLEVRETAGQVLGGLLHCMFIPEQENLLEEFKKKARTKVHKRQRMLQNKEEVVQNSKVDTMRIRHAGVLGLCAFIQAHPYDVPKYLPSIFEHLGLHMNDPQPIPTTIRKTLGDFKRTHYDGWSGMNGHAEQFTEEQLVVLQDLTVPSSHYA